MARQPEDVNVDLLGRQMAALVGTGELAATFVVGPFEAYTLVAVLQLCVRHPDLSDAQRGIVVASARAIADQLYEMVDEVIGEHSTIRDSLELGFEPANDRPRLWTPGSGR